MASQVTDDFQDWTKEILPRRGLLDIPWRELWQYRDLIWLLAFRDVTSQYKQTILGPFWFVLQPLIATAVFSFLFGRMAGLGTEDVPHFLFYMAGVVPWAYFSECVQKTAHTFTRNSHIFGKVYFPRLAVPLAAVLANLAAFAAQFLIFLVGLAFYLWKAHYDPHINLHPNWRICLLPLMVLDMAMLGVGVGLIVSALTTKYRDLAMGVTFAVQLWMYASSIVFPLSRIADPLLRQIFVLNPMVPIIEMMRSAFLGAGLVTYGQFWMSFAVSGVIMLIGVMMFNRAEQTAMDAV